MSKNGINMAIDAYQTCIRTFDILIKKENYFMTKRCYYTVYEIKKYTIHKIKKYVINKYPWCLLQNTENKKNITT